MIDRIPDWQSLGILERSVAFFVESCVQRIKSYQHPIIRRLLTPPLVLDKSAENVFQRELIFPIRSITPSDDCGMDSMAFLLGRENGNSQAAELHCVYFHGDDEECDFENPTSSFGLTLTNTMAEWQETTGLIIPARKIISEITMPDGRDVTLDIEDWFDSCLYQAAAKPIRMPRPRILDKMAPG